MSTPAFWIALPLTLLPSLIPMGSGITGVCLYAECRTAQDAHEDYLKERKALEPYLP